MQDLNEVIKDNQNKEEVIKTEHFVIDDFYAFRTKISRLVKDMAADSEKVLVINVQRNLESHPSRQIEYVIDVTNRNLVTMVDPQQKVAIPAAPNYPEVEDEKDPTVLKSSTIIEVDKEQNQLKNS